MAALIALAALGVFAAGVTAGIVGVVTVAIRREETNLTLTSEAPDHLTRARRWLNGVYVRLPRRTAAGPAPAPATGGPTRRPAGRHAQPISGPHPRTPAAYPTAQEAVMNPTHRTRRLSLPLAGLAAAALALPACQSAATAASHTPHHRAAHATVQQTRTGLTVTDRHDLAKLKRDLF